MLRKIVLILGITGVLIFVALGIFMVIPWQIAAGISASIGTIAGLLQKYMSRGKKEKNESPPSPSEDKRNVIINQTIQVGANGKYCELKLRIEDLDNA